MTDGGCDLSKEHGEARFGIIAETCCAQRIARLCSACVLEKVRPGAFGDPGLFDDGEDYVITTIMVLDDDDPWSGHEVPIARALELAGGE